MDNKDEGQLMHNSRGMNTSGSLELPLWAGPGQTKAQLQGHEHFDEAGADFEFAEAVWPTLHDVIVDCVGNIHRRPKDSGLSAVACTGSVHNFFGQQEELCKNLTDSFLSHDLP